METPEIDGSSYTIVGAYWGMLKSELQDHLGMTVFPLWVPFLLVAGPSIPAIPVHPL